MLATLWHHRESESCYYKTDLLSLFTWFQHVRKYGSAFLNSDGGVLMAGILDDGKLYCNNKQSSVSLNLHCKEEVETCKCRLKNTVAINQQQENKLCDQCFLKYI